MKRLTPVLMVVGVVLSGCTDGSEVVAPLEDERPPEATGSLVVDGSNGGNQDFYFLPPLGVGVAPSVGFDPTLAPYLDVHVCLLDEADVCQQPLVERVFGNPAVRPISIDSESGHYTWVWQSDAREVADEYRLTVLLGGIPLGHADVRVGSRGAEEARTIQANQAVVLNFWVGEDAVRSGLVVNLTDGVAGAPEGGVTFHRLGTEIPFEFGLKEGFESLSVLLDGVPVESSGTFTMSTDRVLTASATRRVELSSEGLSVRDAIAATLAAEDRAAAFRNLIEEIGSFYDFVGGEQADSMLPDVLASAFEGATADQIAAVGDQLHGQLFSVHAPRGVEGELSAFSVSSPLAALDRPEVFYVNGINNSYAEAAWAAVRLERTLTRDALILPGQLHLWYNATGAVPFLNVFSDLAESIVQVFNIVTGTGVGQDALLLAASLNGALEAGKNVVAVGHSQGNLFVAEGTNALLQQPGVKTNCLATVSVASPISQAAFDAPVQGFIIKDELSQDILLGFDDLANALGIPGISSIPNDFPTTSTSLSRFFDLNVLQPLKDQIDQLLEVFGSDLYKVYVDPDGNTTVEDREALRAARLAYWTSEAKSDLALHSMVHSYLISHESRDLIASAVRTQLELVESNCPTTRVVRVEISPDASTITVGEWVQLTATAFDGEDQPVPDVNFAWESSNTDVVIVSPAEGAMVSAMGIGPGTSSVTATVDGQSAEASFEVTRGEAVVETAALEGQVTLVDGTWSGGPFLWRWDVAVSEVSLSGTVTWTSGRWPFDVYDNPSRPCSVSGTVIDREIYLPGDYRIVIDAIDCGVINREHLGVYDFQGGWTQRRGDGTVRSGIFLSFDENGDLDILSTNGLACGPALFMYHPTIQGCLGNVPTPLGWNIRLEPAQ